MISISKMIVLVILATILKRKGDTKTTTIIVDKTMIMIIDRIEDSILIDNFMRTIDSKIIGIMDIMMTIMDIIKDLHNNKIVHNISLKVIIKECKIPFKIHPPIINNHNLHNSWFKIII